MSIINVPSPNFSSGRKMYRPEAIVIHIMEGTLAGTDNWFQNKQSQVSSHYGIGKNGEVHQYVEELDTAWHAGRVNAPSWQLIKTAGNGRFINPNYYTIGIEHEGNENSDWTSTMYNASAAMIKAIASRWNIPIDRQHIVGHHEIYSLKTCPGHKADLNKLIAIANGNTAPSIILAQQITVQTGKVTTHADINIRLHADTSRAPFAKLPAGIQLAYDGFVLDGELVNGNSKWYYTNEGNWFWSGAVK